MNSTRADVARLLGRVGFGATAEELDEWTGKPYVDLVDHLLDVPALGVRPPLPDDARRVALAQAGANATSGSQFVFIQGYDTSVLGQAQQWWLNRMRTTPWPLEERMALLWHGHFATAVKEFVYPSVGMLLDQNETIRTHALGSFKTLLDAMTVDPAMLWWLNGTENSIPEPNENYAREFLELFTLGTSPQVYTERDIREAARAFTGWYADPFTGLVSFQAFRHDRGRKTVLRKTIGDLGDKEYQALSEIALAQPVAARFIAWKLVVNLAYLPPAANLLTKPDPLVKQVADTLRATGFDIRKALRTLMLSDLFRYASPAHGRQLVREPVVMVVSAARSLGVDVETGKVLRALEMMGQQLFRPPNVGGWPRGAEWFSPPTMIARYDVGLHLHDSRYLSTGGELAAQTFPAPDDLAGWTRLLGLPGLSPTTEAAVRGYLSRTATGVPVGQRRETVLALLLASPDWMVM